MERTLTNNQESAAILEGWAATILDTNPNYAAFGHGTMVMGVIHLVAPKARLLPLKAFSSAGTGYLSDILRAIYYANQNGANVINMSFNLMTSSTELSSALDQANKSGVICAASAGNVARRKLSILPQSNPMSWVSPQPAIWTRVLPSPTMATKSFGSPRQEKRLSQRTRSALTPPAGEPHSVRLSFPEGLHFC
jgi:subtilisin family serine protease